MFAKLGPFTLKANGSRFKMLFFQVAKPIWELEITGILKELEF